MTLFGLLILLHVTAAVCGIGGTFIMPLVISYPKTVSQALFSIELYRGISKVAKIGGIVLLLTGVLMGIMNTYLWGEIWFTASLVLYVLIQPIFIVMIPRKLDRQVDALKSAEDERLPSHYLGIAKEMAPWSAIAHTATFLLVILMVWKPF
ncbi:DUF2269 family protein [Bacillus sp. 1P06AnD]|uniref:DUF2269 family protein n=1 Tax=Bacillus sp. 1P06AnD TaxID=3132208 RepID=UPI0039A10D14